MSEQTHAAGATSRSTLCSNHQGAAAAAAQSPLGEPHHRGTGEASDLLKRLFRSFDGSLALRLWNGTTLRLGRSGADESEPRFTLVCRNPSVVRSMVLGRDPLRLAEAYFRGDIDIEGDFFVGAYQLAESIKAADRLHECGIAATLLCIFEPGRLRQPRDARERRHVLGDDTLSALFPGRTAVRVVVGHARPEAMAGLLRRIDTGPKSTRFLGYIGRGGTLDVGGMLFANRCTWAHVVAAAADLLALDPLKFLRADEHVAVTESGDPRAVMSRY